MTAVVALGKEASIQRTVAAIESDSMQVATFPFRRESDHWGMVARAAGGTKGTALQWMSDHYGIAMEDTVCVGDVAQRSPDDERRGLLGFSRWAKPPPK